MNEVVDAEVEALRDARGSAAELKVRLVSLRSELPQGLIFVFEGDDDRGIYLSWFRQIDAQVRYEPFSCGGKAGVLRLWDAVKRDINGLSEDVYFFLISAKPQPRKLEAWRKSGSAQGLQPIIA